MSVDYTIDLMANRLLVRARGSITVPEMLHTRARIAGDADYDPRMPMLVDLTEGDLSGVTAEEWRQLARSSLSGRSVRRAFVVRGSLEGSLARMFGVYERPRGGLIEVFHNRGVAEAWLFGGEPAG